LSAAGVEEGPVYAGFAFVTLIVGLDADSAASGTVAAGAEEEEEGPPLSVCCCSDLGVGVDDPDSFSSRRRRIYAYVSQAESQHLNVRFEPGPFSPYLEPPVEGDVADRDP
jgi:hypothetical protein